MVTTGCILWYAAQKCSLKTEITELITAHLCSSFVSTSFSALTLLVGSQEWHDPPHKNNVQRIPTFSSITSTHTHLMTLCPGLPGRASTRKVKPIWILQKQETVSGSGISWARCKSTPCSRQITTPAPHCSVFLQAGCRSCRPTYNVKALKAIFHNKQRM